MESPTLRERYLRLPLWGKTLVGLLAAKGLLAVAFLWVSFVATVWMTLPWLLVAVGVAFDALSR